MLMPMANSNMDGVRERISRFEVMIEVPRVDNGEMLWAQVENLMAMASFL